MEASFLRRVDAATRRAIDEQVFNATAATVVEAKDDPNSPGVLAVNGTRPSPVTKETVLVVAIPVEVYSALGGHLWLSSVQTLMAKRWIRSDVLDAFFNILADECRDRGEHRAVLPPRFFNILRTSRGWHVVADAFLRPDDTEVILGVNFTDDHYNVVQLDLVAQPDALVRFYESLPSCRATRALLEEGHRRSLLRLVPVQPRLEVGRQQ